MPKVSLCMIAQDEARHIERCLRSAKHYVDEIILVNKGSTDNTVQIAEQLGAKIFNLELSDNFRDARNLSLEKATGDWILFLDADEELAKGSGEKLREIIKRNDVTGYFLKIVNYIGKEGWLETCNDIVFRLFRNSPKYRFHGAIHEQIADSILKVEPNAKYQTSEDVVIVHYGYTDQEILLKEKKQRNLEILEEEVTNNREDIFLRYHYGVELFRGEEYEKAATELVKVAQNTDTSTFTFPKLIRYIVISYLNLEKYAEAENYCQIGFKIFPDYADLYYFYGLILYQQKRYSEAMHNFKHALAMPEQPAHYASFEGMRGFRALYYCAKISEEFLNLDEALNYYVQAIRDNPLFTTPLEEIIRILNPRLESDYTKESLNKIFIFDTPEAFKNLGWICYHNHAYRLALDYLNNVGDELANSPEIMLMKAVSHIQLGERLPALRILKNFPKKHTLFPLAQVNLFFHYWLQGNKQRVREALDSILDLNVSSDTSTVLFLFKNSLYKKNIITQVDLNSNSNVLFLDLFKRIIDYGSLEKAELLLSKLSKNTISNLCFEIAKIYQEYGYVKEADKYFLTALQNDPDNTEILYYVGHNHEIQGHRHTAISFYRKIIAIQKHTAPKVYIKIIKLYQDIIQETLQEASKLYPEAKEIRQLLSEVVFVS